MGRVGRRGARVRWRGAGSAAGGITCRAGDRGSSGLRAAAGRMRPACASDSASRERRQEPAAGQHRDRRPGRTDGRAEASPGGRRCGGERVQGCGQRVRPVLGGQGVAVEHDDGLDAELPQLDGGGSCPADPAAHGIDRRVRGLGDPAVGLAVRGTDQGSPRSGGRWRCAEPATPRPAARGAATLGAAGPVRPHGQPCSVQVAHRPGASGSTGRHAPASGQREFRAASTRRAASTSTASINTHSGQRQARSPRSATGSSCCILAPPWTVHTRRTWYPTHPAPS